METAWNSEQLLAEMEWVRRLARALVRDWALADDVAQEAFLVASEQRPDDGRPLRPWLARVVKTLAHTRRRSEARREQRELASYPEREVPKPDELVERVELQRTVAAEVLALAEPHRSTLLLHFFEGMSSADIARRLGIPDATVRRRLATGLLQVRAALRARDKSPKQGWLAALTPLAGLPATQIAPVAMGAFTVKKLILGAVALVLLLAGGAIYVHARGHSSTERNGAEGGATPHAARQLEAVPAWLAQPEVAARRIAGHVRVAGAPAAGATVRLGLQIRDGLMQQVAEVVAGADGAFDFGAQPAATFTVSASAPDHPPASLVVANADPHTKPGDLVLELHACTATLVGKVSDSSGGVIAKARLMTDGLGGTETDPAGQFTLCLESLDILGARGTNVRVEGDGYGSIVEPVIVAGALHHDFVLVPEGVLVGQVVDGANRPVPGARVLADPDHVEGVHLVASNWADADRDGRFRISALHPGKFQLLATAPQLAMPAPVSAVARATQTSREIRLVMAPTARVRGHVVRDGQPVAGAAVSAVRDGLPPGTPSISQPDGSFVLDGVPLGPTSFIAPPYGVRSPASLDVTGASVDGVTITVGSLATLRGRVTRKGHPVAGANVGVSAPRMPDQYGKTDASGQFLIDGVSGGDATCTVLDYGSNAFALPRPVHLTDGETSSIEIDLDRSGDVKGAVVDEAGAPVPGVYVRLDAANGVADHCEAIADSHGAFDCPMLMGGDYVPFVSPAPGTAPGFSPASGARFDPIAVPPDGAVTGARIAIKAERLAIRGVVVDDTGAPEPDVHVIAVVPVEGIMVNPSAYSDASGRFTIENLARGTYHLVAHAGDGGRGDVPAVFAGGDPVRIQIARPGAIEGTLAGFGGPPSVHLILVGSDGNTGELVSEPVIVEGPTFSAIGLPPGQYHVEAIAGADTDGAMVDVQSGQTAHIALRARAVGRVEGRVLEFGTNKPFAGWHCEALMSIDGDMDPEVPPDDARIGTSDGNGHYAVRAPVGRVRTGCIPPPGPETPSWAGTDVDVTQGAVATIVAYAVRPAFGTNPGDPGLDLVPMHLPLTVAAVAPGGPAALAGVLPGDQVVTIDGAPLQGVLPSGAMMLLLNHRPGTTATLGIARGGSPRIAKVTLAPSHR